MENFQYPFFDSLNCVCSCTAKIDEWEYQRKIQNPKMIKFYGVHPWYAEQWNNETEKILLRILSEENKAGIGEIGMDNLHPNPNLQRNVFSSQLKIASEINRPVTVHMQGFEKEILEEIKSH